jgi:hypothetical protein
MPLLIAYREQPELLTASNITIMPGAPAVTPRLLATPIGYDERALASLHGDANIKMPAAASWSQKVVSALGQTDDALPRATTR